MESKRVLIEVCLEGVDSVLAAEKGGADRVELCSDLFEGGLTPSYGTVKVAKERANILINCMIRPRGGDFCYSDVEFEAMKEDIISFKSLGVNGVVFGILTQDGKVDKKRSRELIELARPLSVTFHRAFDMTRDPYEALDDLIEIGVDRLLTSGQEPTVLEGADLLKELVKRAEDKIIIMPGCGINERNFDKIKAYINAREYHLSLNREISSKMNYFSSHIYMGGLLRQSEFTLTQTSDDRVSNIVGRCR